MSALFNEDTIVAVSTAPGRGAIAVIRVSGVRAHDIARQVIHPWPTTLREAHLATAREARGGSLDRPLVTVFAAPRSYTGEDLVEIATHGGTMVPASIVAALVAAGAREALPGEFTRRAVLNGKMDLPQAEAVGDLIEARSTSMQRAAVGQLDGGLTRRVAALRESLIALEALIAYDIDFPEEDDGPIPRERIANATNRALDHVRSMLATTGLGELIRDGALVVIAGPPNAGKSSLFNALLGQARALVTEIPGTTRDAIEALIEPTGAPFPLRLVDTAGIRESHDTLEKLGIEVSLRYLAGAHAVLACAESENELTEILATLSSQTNAPIIAVQTKLDLIPDHPSPGPSPSPSARGGENDFFDSGRAARTRPLQEHDTAFSSAAARIQISATEGTNLNELLRLTIQRIQEHTGGGAVAAETPIITHARHKRALETAESELQAFQNAWDAESVPPVIAAVHLRAAISALDDIIGAVRVNDVLDRLFKDFCVGK